MKYRLLHTTDFDPAPLADAFAADDVAPIAIHGEEDLVVAVQPTVLLLDSTTAFPEGTLRSFVVSGGAIVGLCEDGGPEMAAPDVVTALLVKPYQRRELLVALRAAYQASASRRDNQRLKTEAMARTRELVDLTRIGVALNTERDYHALLELVLLQARRITRSDAGSLYLVEEAPDGSKQLHFTLAETQSRPDIPFVEFTIPIDHSSIAGYVASTSKPVVLDDAYALPDDVEFSINRSFDEKYGYRTKSMLALPMRNHKSEVIGVLQLINRKRKFANILNTPDDFENEVIPYSDRTVELVSGMAGQAAVSIENNELYKDIEKLFEGFVTAAVTAIEQRDPTTSGHSGRVAAMTVNIAQITDRISTGKYKDVSFTREQLREIRYAGLLHDFGKVGVREEVLVKAKKLYQTDLVLIKQRHAFISRTVDRDFYRECMEYLEKHGKEGYETFRKEMDDNRESTISKLDHFLSLVVESNEPSVLPEGNFAELIRYQEQFYQDLDGTERPFLTQEEGNFLTIRKGSLDAAERSEIENHVNHTYNFLLQIPWTEELKNIPRIAYGHHELMNGAGYPRGVGSGDIPVQTRMMTIADIFDALTAADRPYKKAIPRAKALDILNAEVKDGRLDSELFQVFCEAKAYEMDSGD